MNAVKRKTVMLVFVLINVLMLTLTCSDEDNPVIPNNQPPTKPVIDASSGSPSDGATNVSITHRLSWKCSDPDNDKLTYNVYFGESSTPPLISEDQSQTTYFPGLDYSETYYWRIVAKDSHGATTRSDTWRFTTKSEPETINAPNKPTGLDSGLVNDVLVFFTGGSISNLGHSVQYRFDWGNGDFSDWSSSTSASYFWSVAGTYYVKAQAHCALHPEIESVWSPSKKGVIREVADPQVCVSPDTLDFGEIQTSKSFAVTNCGGGTLDWDVVFPAHPQWIVSTSPPSGTTTTETDYVVVTVDRSILRPGTYYCDVVVRKSGGGDVPEDTVVVKVVMPGPKPQLSVSPTYLDFGVNGVSKQFTITNCGDGTLEWHITVNRDWISVSPVYGSATTETDQVCTVSA